ncbi:MAG: hypothetical protein QOD77_582 [Thermoplasmata archaeon]|jgi:X-Pro dipeptidyl-peptidase|nr:hypothetical protein [Thermoplasmata archaeon]
MRILVAAFLVAALLAGCLGDSQDTTTPPTQPPAVELSPKLYDVLPAEEAWIGSPQDGVRLHNAVYRPDTDAPVPVFINFSPYWGDSAMLGGDNFARYMVEEYVPRGYAVVLSAVRGTGHSEGCFQIGGDVELQDAHDVVDFFAKQPWSSGAVAAGGKSYDSTTQNGMVAKFPHPALKGIFHVSGITDMYAYNYKAGVPYSNGLEFTPRYFATQAFDEYLAGEPADEGPESLARVLDDAACAELPEHVASGEGSAAHGIKDAYWVERDWAPFMEDSTWNGTVFFVHGLSDWNVKPDHILPWVQVLQQKGVPVLGWLHQWSQDGTGHVYPMRADWNQTMLAWLDFTLKGKDVPVPWGYEAQGSDELWRRSDAWPPASRVVLVNGTGDAGKVPPGTRLVGVQKAEVRFMAATADPVLRVVVYDGDRWVTEGVARPALSEDLSGPAGYVPGTEEAWMVTLFPVDHVVEGALSLAFGFPTNGQAETPSGFVATPRHLPGRGAVCRRRGRRHPDRRPARADGLLRLLRIPMKTVFAAALLLAALLAGCANPEPAPEAPPSSPVRAPLTEPLHKIGAHLDHTFVATTGTQLYVDYVLPEPLPQGGAPVILVFTPYQDPDAPQPPAGEGPAGQDAPYNTRLVEDFVPRGYAVAFADVRGNHNAGGCVDQTGPEQWQDGYDYVEWLGTQAWSNGNVGMYGASYDGETQFTTAMMAPPHLKAIVPVASVSNQYEWSFYQGVPYETQPTLGMAVYLQGSLVPSTDPDNAALYPEKLSCQDQMLAAGVDFSGDMNAFWKRLDYRPMAGNITAAVLHVHGLVDWNVRPVHIDPLFNDIQSTKRAIYGQWAHAYPDRKDWQDLLHAWYDHFLFGRENGILDILPPVLIEDDQGAWHGIESFPPPVEWLELELTGDGRLVPSGQAEPVEAEIADYPEEAMVGAGAVDVSDPSGQLAPDRLAFAYTPDRELRLVGRPELRFTATTDEKSTHWGVHLGAADCAGASDCLNTGYQDTRHRDGLDNPKDLESGVPYNLTVRMYPQYDVLGAGQEVTLTLLQNDGEVSQDPTFARSMVALGGGRALLRLPVHSGGVPLPADELPETYPGYL